MQPPLVSFINYGASREKNSPPNKSGQPFEIAFKRKAIIAAQLQSGLITKVFTFPIEEGDISGLG